MTRIAPLTSLHSRRSVVASLIGALEAAAATVAGTELPDFGDEADMLVREPLSSYLEHVHWPSNLTGTGMPIEISLALDAPDKATFRYTTDLANHNLWLAGNWRRYLDVACETTGTSEENIWRLFADHVTVNPPTLRSPVYHGVGYGEGGLRRSSIYFFIGGLTPVEFAKRFATQVEVIEASLGPEGRRPARFHGVSYDFDDGGGPYRTKFYGWLDLEKPATRLSDTLGSGHGLEMAQALMNYLIQFTGPQWGTRSTLLQSNLSGDPLTCGHKIFLNCEAWNLDRPEAILRVVEYLADASAIDLSPLYGVLASFADAEITLLPQWIAIGQGEANAPLTFYFTPEVAKSITVSQPVKSLADLIDPAVRHLLRTRSPDGSWSNDQDGDPSIEATAVVAVSLANIRELREELGLTRRWLVSRLRADPSLSTGRIGLLAQLAVSRLDPSRNEFTEPVACTTGTIELDALELLVRAETRHWSDSRATTVLTRLADDERWIGGWAGDLDHVSVTTRIIEALQSAQSACDGRLTQASELIARASYLYSEYPVVSEPAAIAAWLKGGLLSNCSIPHASIGRALDHLSAAQHASGYWLSTPVEHSSGKRGNFDQKCLLTTAQVVESLAIAQSRMTS